MIFVILSSLLVAYASSALCKSITVFGGAFMAIDYCLSVRESGLSKSYKLVCNLDKNAVVMNMYDDLSCKGDITATDDMNFNYTGGIFGINCDGSVCKPSKMRSIKCISCFNDNCVHGINPDYMELSLVVNQCIVPDWSVLNGASEKGDIVAVKLNCLTNEAISYKGYSDEKCTTQSMTRFSDIIADKGGEATQFEEGCNADGEYLEIICDDANTAQSIFAIFVAIISLVDMFI
eukprot:859134_1